MNSLNMKLFSFEPIIFELAKMIERYKNVIYFDPFIL